MQKYPGSRNLNGADEWKRNWAMRTSHLFCFRCKVEIWSVIFKTCHWRLLFLLWDPDVMGSFKNCFIIHAMEIVGCLLIFTSCLTLSWYGQIRCIIIIELVSASVLLSHWRWSCTNGSSYYLYLSTDVSVWTSFWKRHFFVMFLYWLTIVSHWSFLISGNIQFICLCTKITIKQRL